MPSLRITTEGDKTEFQEKRDVVLTAVADGSATDYSWSKDGKPLANEVSNKLTFTMAKGSEGRYVVEATVDGQPTVSQGTDIKLKAASPGTTPPGDGEEKPTEQPPIFHPGFALLTGLIALAVGAGLIYMLDLLNRHAGFSEADWAALDARLKVAVVLAIPMIVLGVLLLIGGFWMAIVEWRGRFKKPDKETHVVARGVEVDVPKLVAEIGKLRGAALVLVIGATLMIAAAWIGQSAAGTDPAPTPAPTAAPTPG